MNTIRIYRFINPSIIFAKESLPIKIICGANRNDLNNILVLFNKQTGHFVYSDNTTTAYPELKRKYSAPQTEQEARKAVEQFIETSNKIRIENDYLKQNKFPNLFANLQFQSALPILDIDNKIIEQWDIKYTPFLSPSYDEPKVPVMNAEVVFSIGIGSILTALKYNWMPIERVEEVKRFQITLKDENGNDQQASIIYMIEPDKNLCAPYLLAKDDKQLNKLNFKNDFNNNLKQPA